MLKHKLKNSQKLDAAKDANSGVNATNENNDDTLKQPKSNNRLRVKRKKHAQRLRKDIDKHAWDGQWYRQTAFDGIAGVHLVTNAKD
jgi:cellobiose phosphorylase